MTQKKTDADGETTPTPETDDIVPGNDTSETASADRQQDPEAAPPGPRSDEFEPGPGSESETPAVDEPESLEPSWIESEFAHDDHGADTEPYIAGPEFEPEVEPERESESEPVSEPEPVQPALAAAGPADDTHGDPHDDPEVYEDQHYEGPSFASRALTFLLLLLAGAGLGIWAAPKIAPMLPSGMAPVAQWLTPGASDAQEHVDSLAGEVESLQTQVAGLPGASAIEEQVSTRIASAVDSARAPLEAEIEALRSDIAGGDTTALRQQVERLDSALQGQIAELSGLKDQLSGGIAASSEASDEAVAKIDVYRAELEGLRAEMSSVSDDVTALRGRIDEVAATADRSIDAAEAKVAEVQAEAETTRSAAEVEGHKANMRAALAAAQPFQDTAARLQEQGIELPAALMQAAEQGVPTMLMLRESFPDAAHEAIRASIMAGSGDTGFMARSKAYVEAQLATRSLTPQDGMDADAVLSRMEEALRHDNLEQALAESEALPSEAREAMAGWLGDARARAAADEAMETLGTAQPTTN